MKFKHGEKVTCEIYGEKITDAKISIDKDGTPFICQNIKDGNDAEDKLGYKYSWILRKDFTHSYVTNLKSFIKSFDNPQIGDEYKDENGYSRFVLGVLGRVIHLSRWDDKDAYWSSYTKEELIKNGYTIVQDEPEEYKEVTMEEVCEKFGHKVKIKKD